MNHSKQNNPNWKGGEINKICESCFRIFTIKPCREKKRPVKFCSMSCYARKIIKICGICNNYYKAQRWNIKSKFCSKKCAGKAVSLRLSGSGSHTWKGGITPQRVIDRNTPEIREWKRGIFRKDGFSCVLCGKHGGYLIADHFPFPFYKYPNKRTNLENGRTLCLDCDKIVTYKERVWASA